MTGTGFTYSGSSPNIQLTGGTITGIEEQDSSGNVLATFTRSFDLGDRAADGA